jgi:hypothetical protein
MLHRVLLVASYASDHKYGQLIYLIAVGGPPEGRTGNFAEN